MDLVGRFADCLIVIEDNLEGERVLSWEESREVEIQEITWMGGPWASVHTLYTISD
jgi:hypothetical protein